MATQIVFRVAGKTPCGIRNREPGDVELVDNGQAIGATDGAQVFAYDMSLSTRTFRYSLANLTRADRDRFQAFFDDDAQGAFVPWSLTIPGRAPETGEGADIVITGCRFSSTVLEWVSSSRDGWYSVSFEFFTQTEGPTGPPT